MREMLFLSHNIRHQRCEYLSRNLMNDYRLFIPHEALSFSSRLSVSSKSASSMFYLGISALRKRVPTHLDGIDVFIHPFLIGKDVLHDYHVPLVPELKWLGLHSLAAVAHALLPDSLRKAKVVIAPNREMLNHAAEYARLNEFFVIPNYPPERFYLDIKQEDARLIVGLPVDKQVALFVGGARLREIYGIELLLNTWSRIRRKKPDALLCILGPTSGLGLSDSAYAALGRKGIVFPGSVNHQDVPKWIAASDLCLSQRTPGFPAKWYNIHDSLKLSEYALFEKPIVAAGYSPGADYISADTTVESYSRAIISGLNGDAPKPTPHTWEENLSTIRKAYSTLMNG